jgi:hypothetical protein
VVEKAISESFARDWSVQNKLYKKANSCTTKTLGNKKGFCSKMVII